MDGKKRSNKSLILIVVILVIAAMAYFIWGRTPTGTAELSPQEIALQQLEAVSDSPVDVKYFDGLPVFVSLSVPGVGDTSAERAENFLEQYLDFYLQNDPDLALGVIKAEEDAVRFYQTYKGLPVYASEIVVVLQDELISVTIGNLIFDVDLDITPAFTPKDAAEYARQYLGDPNAQMVTPAQLVVYDDALLNDVPRAPKLAWKIPLVGTSAQTVLIDANTSEVLLVSRLIYDHGGQFYGFDLDMQDAEDEANATSDLCFNLSNDPDVANESGMYSGYSNDPDATQGFLHAFNTYDFFHSLFNLHSYDNDNSQVEIFIHATVPNASWNSYCELMQFNTGWMDFEVMVHEFTHGMISETSNLIYEYQSGALNESYADTMAVFADLIYYPNDVNFLIAEDRTGMAGGIRRFDVPSILGQPDHMNDYVFSYNTEAGDWGGVHTNSGIPNRAAYLIAVGEVVERTNIVVAPGMIQPTYTIEGIGYGKTLGLYFTVMRIVPSNTKFSQAADFTIAFAAMFEGNNVFGFTPQDVCDVGNAFATVGLKAGIDTDCDGITDSQDNDLDDDGVIDSSDNCVYLPNPNQKDVNYDGIGDACQEDPDGDGIPNGVTLGSDNCPNTYNPDQKDANYNGIGEACDPAEDGDMDDDNIKDEDDNCPHDYNPGQENVDPQNDDRGDACDPDTDGDGFSNDDDNCPFTANSDQADADGDGAGDVCDKCPDVSDVTAWTSGMTIPGPDGDIVITDPQPYQPDSDGDGIPDACDDNIMIGIASWYPTNDAMKPNGGKNMGQIRGEPGSILVALLPDCPDDKEALSENYRGQLYFEDLDPNIFVRVLDSNGANAAKPIDMNGIQLLKFRPLGGQTYSLLFTFGLDYPSDQATNFSLSYLCGEVEPVEDEHDDQEDTPTATPTPESELRPPTATGIRNATCREGGESAYPEVDFLLQDQTAPIVGISEDGNYYFIAGPTWGIDCWVWRDLVETEGDLSRLPVIPYPPLLPTATPSRIPPTPTPTRCSSSTGAGCP